METDESYLDYNIKLKTERDVFINSLWPLAEAFCENPRDWINSNPEHIADKSIRYLLRRGKKEQLLRIYRRLNIIYRYDEPNKMMLMLGSSNEERDKNRKNPYTLLSYDAGFLRLVFEVFSNDNVIKFKHTKGCPQGVAAGLAKMLKEILESKKQKLEEKIV